MKQNGHTIVCDSRGAVFALVDCNNFFVSCERVFRPDLWNKPVAVLSNNDGCIVARSNEVKLLGVPMGIPLFKVRDVLEAHKVTLFSGNFPLYGDFSQRVVKILQAAAPYVEVYSVDESFLEISSLRLSDYTGWARALRQCIFQWTGIPVSIGVASTKTLAKAAAEYAKQLPETEGAYHAQTEMDRERLLKWLSVSDIWGIGWRTAPKLRQRGIATAYDLAQVSDAWAQAQMGIRGVQTVRELKGEVWFRLATDREPQKSIARTRSFGHNMRNYYELEGAIATFAAQASAKLRSQQELTEAVMIFLRPARRFEQYQSTSVVIRLMQPSADTGVIIEAALKGLQAIYDPDLSYKKGGVILVDLKSAQAVQVSLFETNPQRLERQSALMRSVDAINKRFNTRLVRHASEHIDRNAWHSKREQRSPAYMTSWAELPLVRAVRCSTK